METSRTQKKVCLFTGAGGLLGSTFIRMFAHKYHIVAVYRRRAPDVPSQRKWLIDPLEPGLQVAESGNPIFSVQSDLTGDREIQRVVELAMARYDRIDLLVNAAATWTMGPMVDSDKMLASMEDQFMTNTMVPIKLAAHIAKVFWREDMDDNTARNRNVINVSSTSGLYVYPNIGQSVYSATKAALNQLTYHMAHEFKAIGVRVNATAPTSFPQIVTSEAAARTLVRLDEGEMTGKILILDANGERLIP